MIENLSLFKPLVPTEAKIKLLAKKLMEESLYLDDSHRDYNKIYQILFNGFSNGENLFYEIGENFFSGIIGFVNVENNWRGEIVYKMWDEKLWGPKLIKQTRKLIKAIMDRFNLKRLSLETACEKAMRICRLWSFKIEGRFKYSFKWNDEFFTVYKLRILKEEMTDEIPNSKTKQKTKHGGKKMRILKEKIE